MDSPQLKTANKRATGIAHISTKDMNLRVSEQIKALAEAQAKGYDKGMTDVVRDALYYWLIVRNSEEGNIIPDDNPMPLFSIIPDPDDIQNRNASIDATVSLDVKFFFRDISNKTGVLEGELLGELARLYTMHQIGLLQSTHESPIIKIDVTHDDLVVVDSLFGESETKHFSHFITDVFRAGLEQMKNELSRDALPNEEIEETHIQTETVEIEPEDNERSEVYQMKKDNVIKRMASYFINHGDTEEKAIEMAKEWVDKHQEEVVMSFCFYDVDNIIDDDVFIDIVENGFNEDRYMTLDRESDAKKQFEQLLNDKLEKQASEYEVKIKALAAESHEGTKHRQDLTIFLNKTRDLINFYEESTSIKGMFTKYSRKQLVEMFPAEYQNYLQ